MYWFKLWFLWFINIDNWYFQSWLKCILIAIARIVTHFLNINTEKFNLVKNLWCNYYKYNSYWHENDEIEPIQDVLATWSAYFIEHMCMNFKCISGMIVRAYCHSFNY